MYAEIFAIACNMVTKPMKHTDMPRTTTGVIFNPGVSSCKIATCFPGGRRRRPSALTATPSTHRTYARHDDRTDAAHRHRQSRVTVSHELARDARPRPRRSLRAFIVPTRATDRAPDSAAPIDARARARALARDRPHPRRTRGRATARDETHPTCSPSRGEAGRTRRRRIGPQIHPHRRR